MQHLVSALFDRWAGQPILVIGGGPSVNKDLPALVEAGVRPACVISANDHGKEQNFFPVDLAVNVDKMHCLKKCPMEPLMRAMGVPVINKHSWADFRLADWTFAGNTGLTAIAVAAALGGNAVIVTGIDMWHGGRLYFHDGSTPKPHKLRHMKPGLTKHDQMRLAPLRDFTRGANIRPVSGPLTAFFPVFDPAETLPNPTEIAYRVRLRSKTPVPVQATKWLTLSSFDRVAPGQQMMLTERELKNPRLDKKFTKLAI